MIKISATADIGEQAMLTGTTPSVCAVQRRRRGLSGTASGARRRSPRFDLSLRGLAYAERAPRSDDWLSRATHAVSALAALAGTRGSTRRQLRELVRRCGALRDELSRLDAGELCRDARFTGQAIRRDGLAPAHVARALALAREATERATGLRPFDSQVECAAVLLDGRVTEMATGEGKTLAATLAAGCAGLAGVPVHIVTVNDYLASRDHALCAPVYALLGLRAGVVTEGMDAPARRDAYGCDICYVSNKSLAFDWLKDRIAVGAHRGRLALRAERLTNPTPSALLLRGLHFAIVDEADSVLLDEAGTPLVISRQGTHEDDARHLHEVLELARMLQVDRHYEPAPGGIGYELTVAGREQLLATGHAAGGRHLEALVAQALQALYGLHRDEDYIVRNGKVEIVDPHTGRVLADRAWEHGLQQLVEASEGVELSVPRDAIARTSYQRFFARYVRLAGMTGTAAEARRELWRMYGLDVVRIASRRPSRLRDLGVHQVNRAVSQWQGVTARVAEVSASGRPVLVGTPTVAASEALSEVLHAAGVDHQVLNARQDAHEAACVAAAGKPGAVTVATAMAGRGTDIRLSPGVAELGGLHVMATALHDARRIDRQLFGRAARQGDPGSCETLLGPDQLPGPAALRLWRARRAQRRKERFDARRRRALVRREGQLEQALGFASARGMQ